MDAKTIIIGAVALIIGVLLLPLVGNFVGLAKSNDTMANISGMSAVLNLVAYGFTFGLVGVGIGMLIIGFRGR